MSILAVAFGITALGHVIGDNIALGLLKTPLDCENSVWTLLSFGLWLLLPPWFVGFFTYAHWKVQVHPKLKSIPIYCDDDWFKNGFNSFFEAPGYFLIGLLWILVHVTLLLLVAKLIKAPLFFVAVGSQVNVYGQPAPIVASVFHPALAPVGVLLVLGYAIGTYGAYATAKIMRLIY